MEELRRRAMRAETGSTQSKPETASGQTASSVPASTEAFDYVVVGAGSAGCIVAARLAEAGAGSVLLLEAGDTATAHPETLSADGFKHAFANDDVMWHRMSAKQADCGGRSVYLGSGRVLGGSGSVNGMVYTRGDRRDFDAWPSGWKWAEVQPAFEAVEARLGLQARPETPFASRFLDAAVAAGFSRKDGMNDGVLSEVVGCNDMNYQGDARRSSYRAWLHDAVPKGLHLRTQARVHRLLFDSARKAHAVEYEHQGALRRIAVRREVLLCGGALETPKLLQLSGVGPAELLASLGIPLVQAAPAVGSHLQDHPNVCVFYRSRALVDFQYPQLYAFGAAHGPAPEAAPDTCFVCYAAPASLKESMLRMLPILALPGVLYRLRLLRGLLRACVRGAFRLPPLQRFVSRVFGVVVILGKPLSRGSVRIRSADPRVDAKIDPAYYSHPEDRTRMAAAIERAHGVACQQPLQSVGARLLSKAAVATNPRKRQRWIEGATMTTFHYCGSCRMGEGDDSPVDPELRVKGIANVRVADASVMPEIPVSALNAASMMIGYRAADFITAGAQP